MIVSEVLIPLAIVVIGIGSVVWMLVWIRRHHRAVRDDPALWQGRDYACPACGAPLEQGWVLLGKGAIYAPRTRGRPGAFSHLGDALPNTISMHLRPAANMAWHCGRCRLLLLDHDKLVR